MHNPYLIGTRIYLRPLDRSDAAAAVRWLNDAEVNRTLRRCKPVTLSEEEDWLASLGRGETDLVLGIALRENDRLIGCTGLNHIDWRCRHAELGIMIGDKPEQGKGHGTAATQLLVRHAFETLNLNRVWLEVYEYNPRARHIYEKIGFRTEGVLRQATFREGRYWDTLLMGLLREEWRCPDQPRP